MPPSGSFSWIDAKRVNTVDLRSGERVAAVKENEAPIFVGSALENRKPEVVGATLKAGTLLVVIGSAKEDAGTSWLPVQPAVQEVRYIPASAVQGSTAVPLAAGGAAAGAAPSAARATIDQADQAWRAGQYDRAQQLYQAAAKQATDYKELAYCYTQLANLAQAGAPAGAAAQATAKTTALSPGAPPASPLTTVTPGWQWSKWGYLRKTAIQKDGRPVYVLEDERQQPVIYAVAAQGMTLDTHLGKMLTMYGDVTYASDPYLRTNYMTVSQVALLPPR
jgi:hypothetical protein